MEILSAASKIHSEPTAIQRTGEVGMKIKASVARMAPAKK